MNVGKLREALEGIDPETDVEIWIGDDYGGYNEYDGYAAELTTYKSRYSVEATTIFVVRNI